MNIKELCQAIIDDKELQFKLVGKWFDGHRTEAMHTFLNTSITNDSDQVRIKPKANIVNLSILIKSEIDCEFSDFQNFSNLVWYELIGISDGSEYPYCTKSLNHKYCRPRIDHTYSWAGGKCPLPEGLKVEITFRSGQKDILSDSENLDWNHKIWDIDIIAFKILGLADGWKWSWENKQCQT